MGKKESNMSYRMKIMVNKGIRIMEQTQKEGEINIKILRDKFWRIMLKKSMVFLLITKNLKDQKVDQQRKNIEKSLKINN